MASELMRRGEVLLRLGCGRRTLARLVRMGRLVPVRWHEKGRALYLRGDVERVVAEMRIGECGVRSAGG